MSEAKSNAVQARGQGAGIMELLARRLAHMIEKLGGRRGVDGFVDRVLAGEVIGWAFDPNKPHRRVHIVARCDGKIDIARLTDDWSNFAAKIPEQLRTLESAGIIYRLAPPGARIVYGVLEANSEFPGQPIEYRVRGGKGVRYSRPVRVTGPVELRTRSYDRRRSSRVVEISR